MLQRKKMAIRVVVLEEVSWRACGVSSEVFKTQLDLALRNPSN